MYQLVQDRVGRFLKPLPRPGTGATDSGGREGSVLHSLMRHGSSSSTSKQTGNTGASTTYDDDLGNEHSRRDIQQPSSSSSSSSMPAIAHLHPLSTENAMAGAPLPPRGFCLRLVTGEDDDDRRSTTMMIDDDEHSTHDHRS